MPMDVTQTASPSCQADPGDPAVLLFGPFALHRARQLLLRDEQAVRLGSRAYALLVELVESAGQLRTREQLEARIWPRSVVEETSLRVQMSALRKALGDGRDGARYIANIPGCGYRFVGTVTRLGLPQPSPAPAERHAQLVGRAAELQALQGQCLQSRLCSIVGPGGIGKTSLALAVAELIRGRFADGVLLVDLTPVTEAGCVIDSVAAAAGVELPAGHRMAALCAGLGARRLLLVLDNCDRAIEGVAALAMALLQNNSRVHMLATTREPLDVQGEQLHWLRGLRAPDHALADPRAALAHAAVELFVERARARDDRFALDEANAADVCRLCRYLDGIPLAIEFAAARVESLGVAALADSLGDLLGLLTRPRRTALPRHRTMAATLAWSYELLTPEEQAVLCRSAVFQADFSVEAACAVCACAAIDRDAVRRCIQGLAAKSLLARKAEDSAVLYRQLAITRSYALGKLPAVERACLAERHARHVAALLARSADAVGAQAPVPWVREHGRSFEDFRAALDWAFGTRGDPALGVAMMPNLILTLRFLGLPDDFRRRLVQALDQRGTPRLAPETALSVYSALAVLGAYSHTDLDLLRDIFTRLRALLDGAGLEAAGPGGPVPASLRMQALMALGVGSYGIGDYPMMRDVVQAMRALAAQECDRGYAINADRVESSARHFLGEHAASQALCQRVLQSALSPSAVDVSCPTPSTVGARWNLARIAWIGGKPELAARLAHESLAYAEQRQLLVQCQTLTIVALPVALWRGDVAHAARLAARLETLAEACRSVYWQAWARAYQVAVRRYSAPAHGPAWPEQEHEPLAPIVLDTLATFDGGMLCAATVARAQAGAIGWCAAEVLRARGEQLLGEGDEGRRQAGVLFVRALALAREQRALAWELRIACSLARYWRDGLRADEGRRLLAGVLERFDEGRATADWRAGAALLAHASLPGKAWPSPGRQH